MKYAVHRGHHGKSLSIALRVTADMTSVLRAGARRWARATAAAPLILACALPIAVSRAAPATYEIDPNHTHPVFETDHYGMSLWRGLFRKTRGTITLDATAGTGTVDIVVDIASIDLGNDALNDVVANSSAPPVLEAARYPTAHFTGTLGAFANGAPTAVNGYLTLHGVTRPLALDIRMFKCIPELPPLKRDVCGADALGAFDRAAFGITVGRKYGFNMDVMLRIQVEAFRTDAKAVP